MDENIVVHVEIDSGGTVTTSVQVVPLAIAWEDFELMLKVFADTENIDVFYKDDEDDLIKLSSQEELELGLMIAKSGDSTLCLRVCPKPAGACELRDANPMGEIKACAPPPPEPLENEKDCPTSETNRDETDEDDQGCMAAARSEKPKVAERKYFFLKHVASCLVLDVAEYSNKPGTRVILFGKKSVGIGNQLWYFDEQTHTLRSQFCDLCLDVSETGSKVEVYQEGRSEQTWIVSGNRLSHMTTDNLVIGPSGDKVTQGSKVMATEENTDDERLAWSLEYKDIHMPGRPQAKQSTNSHQYYSDLAQSMAQMMFGAANQKDGSTPNPQVGGACNKQNDSDGQARATPPDMYMPEPPQWLLESMKQMQQSMIDEVSSAVATKTVSEVLKGLEGAVIASVSGSSGIMQPPQSVPTGCATQRPAYHHYGIVCDRCEKAIVGVRYKCGNCEDFDLCSDCEALSTEDSHPSNHVFLKIYKPVMSAGRKKDGGMLPLLRHNIYIHAENIEKHLQNPGVLFAQKEEAKQSAPQRPQHKDPIEKLKRKQEKLRKKVEKTEEKIKKKEKRRLGEEEECSGKKEKLELPQFRVPDRMDAEFVCDVSVPDGTRVAPGEKFCKQWTVRNTGSSPWTDGTRLLMIWGNMTPVETEVTVPYTEVGEEVTIAINMKAPKQAGTYQSHWRLAYCGLRFGQRVWCSIIVDAEESQNQAPRVVPLDMQMFGQKEASSEEVAEKEEVTGEIQEVKQVECEPTAAEAERIRVSAKPSQTATPNNTPLESRDPSPPLTPSPEELESERIWTLSSSTTPDLLSRGSMAQEDEEASVTEAGGSGRTVSPEVLSKCMARMELQPHDIDLESLCSLSSTSSEDTDEDFYVVPIPDCFNPTLPPSKATSTTLLVKKDEVRPDSVETTPLLSEPEFEYQPLDTAEPQSSGTDVENTTEAIGPEPKLEEVATEGTNQIEEESEPIRKQDTRSTEEEEQNETETQEASGTTEVTERSSSPIKEESEIPEVKQRSNMDQCQAAASSAKEDNKAVDPLAQFSVPRAMDLASTAVSTCKGIFNTLQGKTEQFVPPTSTWTPTESTWAPDQQEWTPTPQAWTPQPSQWNPPEEPDTPAADIPDSTQTSPMKQLIEMGFANRSQNEALLKKHNNNLEKVIQELVSSDSLDWHVNRH